jgi:hypothetical protein
MSVITLYGIIMLALALLLPAQGFASSGGGCNGKEVTTNGYTLQVFYCFNSDLSGYINSNALIAPNKPNEFDIVGAQATVTDTTTSGQVFSQSAFNVSPNGDDGEIDLDFSSSQYSPAPVSGHVYSLTAKVCAKLSTTDSGTCSSWVTLPALPNVTY